MMNIRRELILAILGFVGTGACIWLFFCRLDHLLKNPATQVFVTLLPVLLPVVSRSSLFSGIPDQYRSALRSLGDGIAAAIILGLIGYFFLLLPVSEASCSQGCPAANPTDLINLESQAVLQEDIDLIKKIFAPNAIIQDQATGLVSKDPELHYIMKFKNEIHCWIEHSAYNEISNTDSEALITTASQGRWGWQVDGVCTMTYDNPPGADRWQFGKEDGCWRIISFIYNTHQ